MLTSRLFILFRWQDISNMAFHRHYFCVESGRAKETVQFETVSFVDVILFF